MDNDQIPNVVLHNINQPEYIHNLAQAEEQIDAYKHIARHETNSIIKQIFKINGDCFSIFDKRAGGILFKDWEWTLIPNSNPLKALFENKEDGRYRYCFNTDEGKILRGSDTYYYFLTNKSKSQHVTIEMVQKWATNYIDFLIDVKDVLPSISDIDPTNRRLLLGILDNIRNVSLLMLNAHIVNYANNANILYDFTNNLSNKEITKWSESCKNVTKYMSSLCFTQTLNEQSLMSKVNDLIHNTIKSLNNDCTSILTSNADINLDKSFRSYREIDNFIENYIAINHALKQIAKQDPTIINKHINFTGAAYGGLELPFIANSILNCDISTSAVVLQSKYADRTPEKYLTEKLITDSNANTESYNILSDDNVLSGKTLQSIINILFVNDIPVDKIAIVRYPSINRINQMIAEDSAVDTSKFFDYINGLVFTSPYSKLQNDNGTYLDELGVFNKDRHRLLEYLYKNGRYSENSEVAEIENTLERR